MGVCLRGEEGVSVRSKGLREGLVFYIWRKRADR